MLDVSDQSVPARPVSTRDVLSGWLAGRLAIVGTAALGFIVTFLLLGREIGSLKNVILPLLVFLPAYLVLVSLNMVWVARSAARAGTSSWTSTGALRGVRFPVLALAGLGFGILAAIWYVHGVAK
jgi:hypothetical protein